MFNWAANNENNSFSKYFAYFAVLHINSRQSHRAENVCSIDLNMHFSIQFHLSEGTRPYRVRPPTHRLRRTYLFCHISLLHFIFFISVFGFAKVVLRFSVWCAASYLDIISILIVECSTWLNLNTTYSPPIWITWREMQWERENKKEMERSPDKV